jgi:hypothetical protein
VNSIDELVAQLAPVADADLHGAAESAEARALLTAILAEPRRARHARPVLILVAAAAILAAAIAVALAATTRVTPKASAALVLHRAAAAALTDAMPGPGQYLYVHSTDVYLDTVAGATSYSALIPHDRQVWFGPSGGRILQTNGAPTFPTDADRDRWIAAGRPTFGRAIDEHVPPSNPLDLPTDADAAYAQLAKGAAGFGNRFYDEIFQEIGDDLRETSATPAQRAALFSAAARLPGIEVDANTTDGAGRPSIAVAKDDEVSRLRFTLLFDPQTYALVGEAESVLAGSSLGYPAGTMIGTSTTLKSSIVDSIG